MTTQISDVRFAECLREIVRADVARAISEPRSPVRRTVALWMTHEMARVARTLSIPRGEQRSMVEEADRLRKEVLNAAGMNRFSDEVNGKTIMSLVDRAAPAPRRVAGR